MACLTSLWANLKRGCCRFCADQRGVSAVEYGLMVALISVAMMATLFAVGTDIKGTLYDKIAAALAGM
jgi:pilus assembly protein Flp/PilA